MTEFEEPSKSEEFEEMKPVPIKSEVAPPSITPKKLDASNLNSTGQHVDLKTHLKDVSLWRQPVISASYLLVTLLVFYATMEGGYSYMSFFISLLLLRVLIISGPQLAAAHVKANHSENAVVTKIADLVLKLEGIVSAHVGLPSDKTIEFWVSGLGDYLEAKVITAVQALKKSETDFRMFKVVLGHCISAYILFWMFCLRTIVFGTIIFYLTWPAIYDRFTEPIDKVYALSIEKVKPYFEKMTEKGKEIGGMVAQHGAKGLETVKAKYEEVRKKSSEKAKAAMHKKE